MKITIKKTTRVIPAHQDRVTLLNCMMGGCNFHCPHFKEMTAPLITAYLKESHPDLSLGTYSINDAVAMLCESHHYRKHPDTRAQILDCIVSEYNRERLSTAYKIFLRERTPMQIAITRQKDEALIKYLAQNGVSVADTIRGTPVPSEVLECVKDALYAEIISQ